MATKPSEKFTQIKLGIVYCNDGEVDIAEVILMEDCSIDSDYDQVLTIKLPKKSKHVEYKEVIVK